MDNRKSKLWININRNWKMILTKKMRPRRLSLFSFHLSNHEPFLISFLRFFPFLCKIIGWLDVYFALKFLKIKYIWFLLGTNFCAFVMLFQDIWNIYWAVSVTWSWLLSISWVFSFLSVLVEVQLFSGNFFKFCTLFFWNIQNSNDELFIHSMPQITSIKHFFQNVSR